MGAIHDARMQDELLTWVADVLERVPVQRQLTDDGVSKHLVVNGNGAARHGFPVVVVEILHPRIGEHQSDVVAVLRTHSRRASTRAAARLFQ
ncbi:hypothetical protein TUM20983_40520 [Mycobacterium antarcticum]|uniref:hypothetical protein n=1 Tax=unclassified Mycolicibacterium TaxID=2636767 RepID=UPI002387D708|nr:MULTISPECIES: hypothetical protein [unclassified Mycolicibacterium]GLP76942.1 hypothetical protein TUM20983_40520 [Mycolicibacterium sp. TUM20983]GLP82637.1 hypothetical protein TUM20984_40570 [Mycolicibacterium sp. TUM20984]